MIYLWALLLLMANLTAWLSTLLTLPGNWLLVLFTAIYAYLQPADADPSVSWYIVLAALVLAVIGEVIEFFAGAAGARRQGGSRRGALLAIVGGMAGSIIGVLVLSPIPILGPLVGALFGGAGGAFAGAWVGESGSGRSLADRLAIGRGAFSGKLLGTAGKLAIGAVMLTLVTLDSFIDVVNRGG